MTFEMLRTKEVEVKFNGQQHMKGKEVEVANKTYYFNKLVDGKGEELIGAGFFHKREITSMTVESVWNPRKKRKRSEETNKTD